MDELCRKNGETVNEEDWQLIRRYLSDPSSYTFHFVAKHRELFTAYIAPEELEAWIQKVLYVPVFNTVNSLVFDEKEYDAGRFKTLRKDIKIVRPERKSYLLSILDYYDAFRMDKMDKVLSIFKKQFMSLPASDRWGLTMQLNAMLCAKGNKAQCEEGLHIFRQLFNPVDPILKNFENALNFIDAVGYPVVVKPDNGVGATSTYKLNNQAELEYFFATKDERIYIMEEYVNGHVETFDGITDSNKNVLIANSTIMLNSIMDNVNEHCDTAFCNRFVAGSDIEEIGTKVVKAFDTRSRFFHFEFFRLDSDKEGLGKKGDLVGLEVNMRAPGAYMPDMINFSYESDVYTIWADMVIYDKCFIELKQKYLVAYIGRRNDIGYMFDHDQLISQFGGNIMLDVDVPEVLSAAMGNHVYMVRTENQEHLDYLINEFLKRCDGSNWR